MNAVSETKHLQTLHRRVRNTIAHNQLIGTRWTALTALEREKYFTVTGWANTATDCDGAPDSVVIESASTGRTRVIAWRSLRNGEYWLKGWC